MERDYKSLKLEQIDLINNQKSNAKIKLRKKFKELEWFFSFKDDLPKNWLDVNILDVTWLVTCGVAKKPNYVEDGIPFLSAQNARPFKANLNKIKYISKSQFDTLTVGGKPEKNDILYTRVGNCGEAAKITFDFDFAIYVSLTLIKPIHELINTDYLVAYLNSYYGLTQANVGAIGTGLKNLNVNNVRRYRIPLPPRAEQDRIVAKVDALMAQHAAIQQAMERIPQLLKDFRQQVLTQAVTGKLTEEWRVGKELEEGTKLFKKAHESRLSKLEKADKPNYLKYDFKDVIEHEIKSWYIAPVGLTNDCIVPGRDKPKSFSGNIPWITTPDLIRDFISKSNEGIGLTSEEITEVKAKIIPEKSVIISIVGRFGLSAVLEKESVINQQLHAFLPSELIQPKFLMYYFKTLEKEMNNLSSSTTIAYINKTKVNSLKVNVPSIEEQQEIVRRVESLFEKATAIEQRYEQLKSQIDSLPQAILHKAFKGELVEQLDSDGSASELLREIEGMRSNSKLKSNSKKR